jgi:hypothetical protein
MSFFCLVQCSQADIAEFLLFMATHTAVPDSEPVCFIAHSVFAHGHISSCMVFACVGHTVVVFQLDSSLMMQ